jgi:hypothetical protein
MDAEEARLKTYSAIENKYKTLILKIESHINNAITNCENYCEVKLNNTDECHKMITYFKNKGFSVEFSGSYDTRIKIQWEL